MSESNPNKHRCRLRSNVHGRLAIWTLSLPLPLRPKRSPRPNPAQRREANKLRQYINTKNGAKTRLLEGKQTSTWLSLSESEVCRSPTFPIRLVLPCFRDLALKLIILLLSVSSVIWNEPGHASRSSFLASPRQNLQFHGRREHEQHITSWF
jgi:hypothetical protein